MGIRQYLLIEYRDQLARALTSGTEDAKRVAATDLAEIVSRMNDEERCIVEQGAVSAHLR